MIINRNRNTLTSSKKGNWLKSTIWIVLIAILFTFCSSSAINSIAQAALNPLKYYQKVEKDNLNKQIDKLSKDYASYITNYQNALKMQVGSEMTLQATIDPSLATESGLEGLNTLKATITSMSKGATAKSSMLFSANGKELTSLEAYTTLEGLYYLLIPDLSKAYLKISASDLNGDASYAQTQKKIQDFITNPKTADTLNTILKKYSTLAIDQVNDVTMKKHDNIIVDNISSDYTRLTVRIDEKTALNITNAILKTAKSDTQLRSLFVDLGVITKKEYDTTIKKAMTSIASELKVFNSKKSTGKDIITMSVWLDDKGNITGRSMKLSSDGDISKFGYRTTKNDNNIGVEAWIISDGKEILSGTGRLTAKLSGITGNIKISYADEYDSTHGVVNVEFKDLKYNKSNNGGFITGDLAITTDSAKDMVFKVKFTGDLTKQDMILDIIQKDKSIANISCMIKEIPFKDFSLPTASDKTYDISTQMNNYMLDADVKGFLKGIKEKSDIKSLDAYIDTILASYVE